VPGVACFDTAVHAAMPEAARTYAVPARWRTELGIRRYGFHGLAHDWASTRAAELLGRPLNGLRMVVAHLGAGASACAVVGGRSVDTTMGFTPTAGLVGDPQRRPRPVGRRLADPARRGPDLRGRPRPRPGLGSARPRRERRYAPRPRRRRGRRRTRRAGRRRLGPPACGQLAAMTAAAGGIDVLAFSGGIEENAPDLRRRVVDGLGFLGLAIDPTSTPSR
jgi:acetate kinase